MSSAVERLVVLIFSRVIILPIILLIARTDSFILGTSKESISNLFVSQVSLHQKAISKGVDKTARIPVGHKPNPVWMYFAERLNKHEDATYLLVILESADNPLCMLETECGLADALKYISSRTRQLATFSYRERPKGFNTLASELTYLCSGAGIDTCLPRIANRRGILTRYYHPNDLNFYGRRKIMKEVGFNQLISLEEDENKKSPLMGALRCLRRQFCAPSDGLMFARFISTISSDKGASFNSLLTIDLHPPYGGSSAAKGYSSSRKKSLAQVGRFVDKVVERHAEANKRLYMVLAADHAPSNLKESKADFPTGFWVVETIKNTSSI